MFSKSLAVCPCMKNWYLILLSLRFYLRCYIGCCVLWSGNKWNCLQKCAYSLMLYAGIEVRSFNILSIQLDLFIKTHCSFKLCTQKECCVKLFSHRKAQFPTKWLCRSCFHQHKSFGYRIDALAAWLLCLFHSDEAINRSCNFCCWKAAILRWVEFRSFSHC